MSLQQLDDFSVADLTRALVREYLSVKGMRQTLVSFEKEDPLNSKKISKSKLVQLLSLKHLCILNKRHENIESTLIEILVAYLNRKYQIKNNYFSHTQPEGYYPAINQAANAPKTQLDPLAKGSEKNKLQIPATSGYQGKKNQVPQRQTSAKRNAHDSMKGGNSSQEVKEKSNKKVYKQNTDALKVIYKKIHQVQPVKTAVQPIAQHKIASKTNEHKSEQKQELNPVNEVIEHVYIKQSNEREEIHQQPSQKVVKNAQVPFVVDAIENVPIEQQTKSDQATQVKEFKGGVVQVQEEYEEAFEEQAPVKEQSEVPKQQKIDEKEESSPIKQNKVTVEASPQMSSEEVILSEPKIVINEVASADEIPETSEKEVPAMPVVHEPIKVREITSEPKNKEVKQQEEQYKIDNPMGRKKNRLLSKNRPGSAKPKKDTGDEPSPVPAEMVQIEEKPIEQKEEERKVESQPEVKTEKTVKEQVAEKEPQPQMRMIGRKKRGKEEVAEVNYPTKFKFDENFKDQIPQQLAYDYQPYHTGKITLQPTVKDDFLWMVVQSSIKYAVKGGGIPAPKKKAEKGLPGKEADRLKQLVFQANNPILPKSWHQGFILSPFETTPYGLKQIEGGPCGIIAAVQCYFLKHLLCCSQEDPTSQTARQVSLVAAIANLLWKVRSSDRIVMVFPLRGAAKVDVSSLRMIAMDVMSFEAAFGAVWSCKEEFIGQSNHGVAALMFSSVLTRGFETIESQMDHTSNPLIGNHGHCTQQLVNMFITGKACSNCFDGDKVVDDYRIKGINQRSQFGFLTVFEVLKYIEVGKNMKNPIFPAWIVCKQFHYHAIFAGHQLVGEAVKCPKLDMIYFDGLYNCGDRIRLTMEHTEEEVKVKDLPLIEQVMMTKWGSKRVDWNGSTKIL